jgi:5-(carboxyamino)imidazole ribonucleotide mutase
VATVSVGKAGARNAGILAAQILGLSDAKIQEKLRQLREEAARTIESKAAAVEGTG